MSEYAEEDVEKLSTPPLVHTTTHPDHTDDDDGAAGALVALDGAPVNGGVPTYDSGTGKHTSVVPTGGGGGVSDGDKGDVTVSSSGTVWTVDNNAISDAKLRDSAALSVIGRSANSTGDPADIAAANDGEVLRRSGTAVGFGTVATSGIADDAVTFAKMQNIATQTVLGRSTASTGDIEALSIGSGLSMSGGTLNTTGPGGITGASDGSPAYELAYVADVGVSPATAFEGSSLPGAFTERGANTASMSEVVQYGRLTVTPPVTTASADMHTLDFAAPATPYTVEAAIILGSPTDLVHLTGLAFIATNAGLATQKAWAMSAFRDSNEATVLLQIQRYTANTTRSSAGASSGKTCPTRRILLKIENDGTNLKAYYRMNEGNAWAQKASETIASHFGTDTIDRVGFYFESFSTTAWTVDFEYLVVVA